MILPAPDTDLSALRDRTMGIPARRAAGVHLVTLEPGFSHWEMTVPAWMTEPDGSVPPGALGILVDATLGTAVMSAAPSGLSMVTSHLQLEVLRPLTVVDGPLTCIGRPTAMQDRFALSAAEVTDGAGTVVMRAAMGSVMFEPTDGPDASLADVDRGGDDLAMTVATVDGALTTTCTPAHSWLANSSGGLHGGAGFLIGERTSQAAVDGAAGPAMRPVEVRAAFLRRIPAQGEVIEASAQLVHRGRRLAATRGEVRGPDGRPAVLIDATYIPA